MVSAPRHFKLGNFKCIVIRDGGTTWTADFLFSNAPHEQKLEALQKHGLQADQIKTSWTCLLIDTGEYTLLLDTGIGSGTPEGGKLAGLLSQEGYPPGEIDFVFLSHGHRDHIGGCSDGSGNLVFSHARHLMNKVEYEFWTAEENLFSLDTGMADSARKNLPVIIENLQFVDDGDEILPGVRVIEAYGHTPGHMVVEVRSQGETMLYLADAALHELHIEHPGWYTSLDLNPAQMVATRQKLYERAADTNARVLLPHFDYPGMGYIQRDGDAWRWRPFTDS